jgi:hypothetical protein
MNVDPALLRAALIGYENQLAQIENAMAEIRRQLRTSGGGEAGPASEGRRGMSAAARKRIAAAQKKRWAAYRKSKGTK